MEVDKKIMITGAYGFLGKNLVAELRNQGFENLMLVGSGTSNGELEKNCREAEFIYHLAGINRPKNSKEFKIGNTDFTVKISEYLKKYENSAPIVFSSSIQASLDNPYGKSKRNAEEALIRLKKENGNNVSIYRLPNLFGKWSKPNYNSVVATFCYNISRNLEVVVNDSTATITLSYVDDVVNEFIQRLTASPEEKEYYEIQKNYSTTVGELKYLIDGFYKSRKNLTLPNVSSEFEKKLYSTYLSYLPKDEFSYPLKMNSDERGSFTEFVRTEDRGQFSVNISKPGITKGNHWHHTKVEKFLVVQGTGVIRLRDLNSEEILEYHVSGKELEVVDIPAGYTHNIENTGEENMVTLMWVNEPFDPDNPDTYYLEV